MGSCCAAEVKEGEPHEDDLGFKNPMQGAYDDWEEGLIKDLGADCTAIPRDFPRMDILVVTSSGNNSTASESQNEPTTSTSTTTGGGDKSSSEGQELIAADPAFRQPEDATNSSRKNAPTYEEDAEAALRLRRDRVVKAMIDIVGISEKAQIAAEKLAEASSSSSFVAAEGNLAVKTQEAADEFVKPDQSDLSHSLAETMKTAGLAVKNESYLPPDPTGHQQVVRTAEQKKPYLAALNCLPVDVLMCFSQAVMFYPSQFLKSQMWQPWAQHMQDLGWTATVFRRVGSSNASLTQPSSAAGGRFGGEETVIVWHEQTLQNHLGMLEDDEKRHTPQFRVSWRLEIAVTHRALAPRTQQVYQAGTDDSSSTEPVDTKSSEDQQQQTAVDASPEVPPPLPKKQEDANNNSSIAAPGTSSDKKTQGKGQLMTGYVRDVNVIISSWDWVLPANGTKPSQKYKIRQQHFEHVMKQKFGLSSGQSNNSSSSNNPLINGEDDDGTSEGSQQKNSPRGAPTTSTEA